jgi:photosystem II stability/assembly factor-like uncharacterized protein
MAKHLCPAVLKWLPFLTLLVLISAGPSGQAADEETPPYKITPSEGLDTKVNLQSVKPIDGEKACILVGDAGMIARSDTGGRKWKIMKSDTTADLHDVRFRTPRLGVAVGEGGKYKSPEIKPPAGLYVIMKDGRYIMDGDKPWSSILRTIDGGKTWTRIEAPTNMTLNGVSWLDDTKVIAVFADFQAETPHDGCLASSDDAGKTWKVFYHLGTPVRAITIGPDRTGWIVGYPTKGDQRILLGGGRPKLLKELTDAEKKQLTADILRGLGLPAGINATSIALGDPRKGLIRENVAADGLTVEGTSAINHANMVGNRAWIVGEVGYVGTSDRKGKKWLPFKAVDVGEKNKVNFHAVAFKDEKTGLIVGDAGCAILTVDGGKTWKRLETGTDKTLTSAVWIDKGAVIVGHEGTVLRMDKTTN